MTTRSDIESALQVAILGTEELVKDLIAAELSEYETFFDGMISQTADAAKDAVEALEKPEAALAVLRSELHEVEQMTRQIAAGFYSEHVEDRVDARMRVEAYERESDLLAEKIAIAEQDLLVMYEARNTAVTNAQNAIMSKYTLEAAIANPFRHSLAHQTKAYTQYRLPQTYQVLLLGDRNHPEWDQAITQLREMCKISGYRPDKDPLIESDGEAGRKFWDNFRQEHCGPDDPRPTGLEDIKKLEVLAENERLNRTRNVVEDRRGIRSRRNITGLNPEELLRP